MISKTLEGTPAACPPYWQRAILFFEACGAVRFAGWSGLFKKAFDDNRIRPFGCPGENTLRALEFSVRSGRVGKQDAPSTATTNWLPTEWRL